AGGGLLEARGGLGAARSPGKQEQQQEEEELARRSRAPRAPSRRLEPEANNPGWPAAEPWPSGRSRPDCGSARWLAVSASGCAPALRTRGPAIAPALLSAMRVCVRNSLGVFRRSTGGSLDNSRTVNPRAAQGARTPNILSSSSVVIEISCGAAAWVRKGGERVLEEVRPPALISRDSAAEKPEAGWAAEAVEACLRLVCSAPRPSRPRKRSGTAAFPSICTVTLAVWKEEGRRCACLRVPGSECRSVYECLCRCVSCQGFGSVRSEFGGHLQKLAETGSGIDIISLAAGCAVCIRINTARIRPAGNGSRFPCTETHRLSTGREMAPRAHKAAGLASEGGWTISALRPSSLSLPGSAWQSPTSACASGTRPAESVRGEN
ncbi:hypothetical protein J1605_018659, partial [Eschrichtius robustus]